MPASTASARTFPTRYSKTAIWASRPATRPPMPDALLSPPARRVLLGTLPAAMGIGVATIAMAADRSSRELLVAHEAMRNERIDTSERGQVQLLFADQSSLSIAPGSDVVINEFLYDPQTQT